MAAPDNAQDVDLEEVRKLLDVLERDLEHVTDDTTAVQRLKDEVQTLRNVLASPVRRHHWVRDSLHGIREAFDTAVADSAKASQYVAEIGRILGL
jgi:cell division septum initiation protein DivIVA